MSPVKKMPSYFCHSMGFKMPKGFPAENFEPALKYQPRDDDVFIATYPKCGTTWCQFIVYLMLNEGEPVPSGHRLDRYSPHLEEVGLDAVTALPGPRVIKTHLPFDLTPYSPQAKYIYVARNPKDCCVSFYHHTRGFPKLYDFADGTFEDFFELFLSGEVDFGDYFDNLLSWFAHKDDENVLFLLYEDMKTDTLGSIKSIGNFLGGPFQQAVENEAVLQKIVEYSSLDSMKKNPGAWSSQRPKDMPDFIRKGVIGDWRNYFSDEQAKQLDEKFAQKSVGSGALHLWSAYDC